MRSSLQPPTRVVSFAGKARSAISMVGRGGDLVVWYEGDGSWATSRAFATGPSPLVKRVLDSLPADGLTTSPWARVLPAARYLHADDSPVERITIPFWSSRFPHPLRPPAGAPAGPAHPTPRPLNAWDHSPMPDQVVLRLAREALDEMALGQGKGTDLLALGFSALDLVGHSFGPRSHEVQDTLARLDHLLGELLTTLDRKVGRGRYVVALTSDHGVAAQPELLAGEGQDAGRVPLTRLRQELQQVIEKELGPGNHVAAIYYTDIYLGADVLDRLRAKSGALERALAVIRGTPGVQAVFQSQQLRDLPRISDPLQRTVALSHFPGRSGDLILVPRPNWLTTSAGTTHGTHNDYDQRVPLLLYGASVRPGRYDRAVTPADLAPTLAALLGLSLPQADGTPLEEAIRLPSRDRTARRR